MSTARCQADPRDTLPASGSDFYLIMRILWILPVVLLAALLTAGLLLLRSPHLLVPAAQWGVQRFSSLRLEIAGLELDLPAREIRFTELHLYQPEAEGPPLFTVLDFSGHTRLRDLWSGDLAHTDLAAASVMIYIAADDEAEDPTPAQWLQHLRYLPREVNIDSVHLINQDRDAWIFPLRALHGRRTADQGFRVTAGADYEGESLDVELAIAAIDRSSYLAGINLEATLWAPASESRARLGGQFRADSDDIGYDFSVDANFRDVGNVLKAFEQAPPLAGSLSLQGRMTGNSEGFALSGAAFELDNQPAYHFEASGELQGQTGGDPTLSLIASGEMDSMEYFLRWLDLDLSPLGSVRASIALSGSLGATVVDQLTVVTQSAEGLWISLNGSSGPGSLYTTRLPADSNFTVYLNAPALAVLDPWLPQPVPVDPGPWQLSARLLEDGGALRVDDIRGQLGDADGELLQLGGQIARVDLDLLPEPAAATGIDLQLKASSSELARPAGWFEQTTPTGLTLEASASLSGNGAALELTEGSARIQSDVMTLAGTGFSANVAQTRDFRPDQIRGRLQLSVEDTAALAPYLGREVPALGNIAASAQLRQRGQQLDLLELEALLAGEIGELNATGSARDLSGDPQLELTTRVSALKPAVLAQVLLGDAPAAQSLPALFGEFALTARPSRNDITLSSLQLASAPEDPLQLTLQATASLADEAYQGRLEADYAGTDTALLEKLTGLRLAPVSGGLTLNVGNHSAELALDSQVGDTELTLSALAEHTEGTITGLSVSLDSPQVRLVDLGLQAASDAEEAYKPAERLEPVAERSSLQQALEQAPRFPLDLRINLGVLRGERSRFDAIRIHLTGEQSRYILREFDFSYDNAPAEIRGIVDISLSPPGSALPARRRRFRSTR
ncbi:hypothetical protein [Kineobactrum salinum]|uniref:Uncharacterized protein n=1 Tax=Kineobactrum salinum TaxID=2708301 RepID=A0A6C0U7Q6_9GAMM|nr:hypothetical protein [Kineobactrum salinum]QIB67379.1 hypothetical protein G3T16_20265 [Kineobactrum salinum]